MKIGNIVSKVKFDALEEFNVAGSLDDIIQGIPTLIIGWDFVKKNYPDYDIFDKQLESNLFWTFKKTEKRDTHEADVQIFINKCYNNLISNLIYVYVDVIQLTYKELRKVIKKIHSIKYITTYLTNNMLYIYGDNFIFGIDMKLFNYIGTDTNKLISKIKTKSTYFLQGSEILIEYKKYIEKLDNNIKFIPYLYAITHE